MSVIQSPELNYNSPMAHHSAPRISRVIPLSGSAAVPINVTSTSECSFELPNKCYNLSRSTLDFKLSIAAPTSGYFNHAHTLGNPIDSISLYTREGIFLADIRNCQMFSRAVTPYVTKLTDFLENDILLGDDASQAGADTLSRGYNCFRNNTQKDTSLSTGTGLLMTSNATRLVSNPPITGVVLEASNLSYTEPNYLVQGAVNAVLYFNYSIPFSEFHHSIFSQDKVMYWGQSLMLRVNFASSGSIGFQSSAAAIEGSATITNLLTGCEANSVRVSLAVETNPLIVQGLVNKVQSSGLNIVTPYVHSFLSSLAGTSKSVSQRLNSGFGQRLLNVYHVVANTGATGLAIMDISNTDDLKVVSYQSNVDNNLLQEYIPLSAQNEIYQIHAPLLKHSVIQNSNVFKYNQVLIDSWREGACSTWKEKDHVLDGLDLSAERIYNIALTTTSATHRVFSYYVVQRTISIAANGQIMIN